MPHTAATSTICSGGVELKFYLFLSTGIDGIKTHNEGKPACDDISSGEYLNSGLVGRTDLEVTQIINHNYREPDSFLSFKGKIYNASEEFLITAEDLFSQNRTIDEFPNKIQTANGSPFMGGSIWIGDIRPIADKTGDSNCQNWTKGYDELPDTYYGYFGSILGSNFSSSIKINVLFPIGQTKDCRNPANMLCLAQEISD